MPRRSGGSSRGFSQPSRPAPLYRAAPARQTMPAAAPRQTMPAAAPPAAMAPMAQQPKQPGMMAQMATTAAGVAVGSAVGHTVGHMMTSGGGSQAEAAPAQPAQPAPPQQQYMQQPASDPTGQVCGLEMKQFMECAQTQHDITLCQGFNEALRQCRLNNGVPLQ